MNRSQAIGSGALLLAGSILFYAYPLFHVQPARRGVDANPPHAAADKSDTIDPALYVQDFWNGPRRRGEGAVAVTQLWDAMEKDAAAAKNKFGRQLGLGGAWHFFVRGRGRVETVGKTECTLVADNSDRRVLLDLGVIVDNTVRDAIGVDVNDFANSQDYNAVSSELNRLVEQDVIDMIRARLTPGANVDFAGCAKIQTNSDIKPLRVTPIWADVVSSNGVGIDQQGASSTENAALRTVR